MFAVMFFGVVHSRAEALISPMLKGYSFSVAGGAIRANYPGHPAVPVRVDLYVLEGNRWIFHNRCEINAGVQTGKAASRPEVAWCGFAFPLEPGDREINMRLWRIGEDGQYAKESGTSAPWEDHIVKMKLGEDRAYTQAMRSRLVTIDKETYRAKIDPDGGATYEFYSKRATGAGLPAGEYVNTLHTNVGAALQVAYHSGTPRCLTKEPLGGQGYYNPTQAGACCEYREGKGSLVAQAPGQQDPESGLSVRCNGTANNHASHAERSLELSLHRMMNWDYGPGYEGPYNAGDQTYLSQTVMAYPDYLEYDLGLKNTSKYSRGALEIPTYYFTNRFRRFYYPENGSVKATDIPVNASGDDEKNFNATVSQNAENWITFEDTFDRVKHDDVTIAWFYGADFVADMTRSNETGNVHVAETRVYHQIKMNNVVDMTFRNGGVCHVRYVVFPYRYDETVTTKYGVLPVRETIRRMTEESGRKGI